MRAELVYDGEEIRIPSTWGQPRPDQMKGTTQAMKLIEVAGRGCYDSMGTGRGSEQFHDHLFAAKHYSVYEHVHFTIELETTSGCVPLLPWLGIPDFSVWITAADQVRLTGNLRHCLEWPSNVRFRNDRYSAMISWWSPILAEIAWGLLPGIVKPWDQLTLPCKFRYVEPDESNPLECFVSLFLEDSRIWSHEMVRHRFNMSQRSGRFCDETDRDMSIHPMFRDYLNECGYLALNQEDGDKLWMDARPGITENDIRERTKLGNLVGSFITQSKMVYSGVVEALQKWLIAKGYDKITARKQARSAARYYLGNGLSTEMIYTASIRDWKEMLAKRINPAADAAIAELMDLAKQEIKKSRYGHLL